MSDDKEICTCGCGKSRGIVISEMMDGPGMYDFDQAEELFGNAQASRKKRAAANEVNP